MKSELNRSETWKLHMPRQRVSNWMPLKCLISSKISGASMHFCLWIIPFFVWFVHMRVKISQVFFSAFSPSHLSPLLLLVESCCAYFHCDSIQSSLFAVISSCSLRNFLCGNRIPLDEINFPGCLIATANRITHLIRWKMCWIIEVNHQRTNGCCFFHLIRSLVEPLIAFSAYKRQGLNKKSERPGGCWMIIAYYWGSHNTTTTSSYVSPRLSRFSFPFFPKGFNRTYFLYALLREPFSSSPYT